jgi:hypothetical protein
LLSYLSTPYKSTIEPYKENVNLIAEVAQQKQNKYDQVLSAIFQKQNQLLDLDLSGGSEEAELKKDNLLKEADNQLNKMASSDLTIPDNINKVENIFSPIVNDKDIMSAASITAFTKKESAYFDDWKKEGKGLYDSYNHNFFLEKAQKNRKMTLKEVKEKGYNQVTAVEFVDYDKLMRESIKELMPDVTETIAQDGARIFTENGKVLSESDILKRLPMNSKIMAQAEINAHYQFQGTDANTLLSLQKESLESKKESTSNVIAFNNKNIGYIREQINNINAGNAAGLKQISDSNLDKEQLIAKLTDDINNIEIQNKDYIKEEKSYITAINDFNLQYKYNVDKKLFEKEFNEDELDYLKTSSWIAMTQSNFADATAYSEKSIKVAYDEVWMETYKHNNAVDMEVLKHTQSMQKEQAAKEAKEVADKEASTITSDIYGTTYANDELLDEEEAKKGEEYDYLSSQFRIIDKNIITLDDAYSTQIGELIGSKDAVANKKALEAKEKEYRRVLTEFTDKSKDLKLSSNIGDTKQTYDQFFKENENIKKYIIQKDALISERNNNNLLLTSINKQAEEIALSDSGLNKIDKSKPIVLDYSKFLEKLPKDENGDTRYNILYNKLTIPSELVEKYLKNELTDKDLDKINSTNDFRFIPKDSKNLTAFDKFNSIVYNKNNLDKSSILKDDLKIILKNSNPEQEQLKKYKETYNTSKNEIASKYKNAFLYPGVIIKDKTTGKGKAVFENAKGLIVSLGENTKYAGTDIDVNYFYRDPNSKSGWAMRYTLSGKAADKTSEVKQLAPKTTTTDLPEKFVSDNGLENLQNISQVTKGLQLQKISGNPLYAKKQEYSLNYLGKKYIFMQDNQGIRAYEEGKPRILINSENNSVEDILETIQIMRETEIQK